MYYNRDFITLPTNTIFAYILALFTTYAVMGPSNMYFIEWHYYLKGAIIKMQEVFDMMENIMIALGIMVKGMAGIFVVIAILTVLVTLMGKMGQKKSSDEE